MSYTPPQVTCININFLTDEVRPRMLQNPPKFQQICLVGGLPNEVLDIIMRSATLDQARLFSATCQRLREVARPYIFIVGFTLNPFY